MKSANDGPVGIETDGGAGAGSSRKKISDWPRAVIASALGLIMAGIAYSLGDAYCNAYLAGFSVHSGAFPADHPTHFVLAVWGGLHATLALQQWLGGHVLRLVCMTAVCLIYFAALPVIFAVISPIIANGRGHVEGARALLGKRPLLRKYAGTVMAIMFFFLTALWFFLFVPRRYLFPPLSVRPLARMWRNWI
ncbi:hypothetical protein DR64_7999 [Paraburkholderia xenovorans LB400]|nr:hypothetical protein [Paraburkholderia xenovorans]AIP34184.1 hypothetical protein DR64_7999 [Paraburkholderia xenovorans LB400]